MKKFARNMKKAFTITELVIVIAVIAILAAVLIPTFSSVISSARESAAMQECRNALTNYSAEAEKKGVSTTGMVFVNNNYVFVNLNGNLQLVGDLGDLCFINSSGSAQGELNSALTANNGATKPKSFVIWTKEAGTYQEGVEIAVTNEGGQPQYNKNQENTKLTLTEEADSHAAENLYIYYIKLNETKYAGYFTLEGSNAEYTSNNGTVTYSRAFGFITLAGSSNMTFIAIA